MLEVITIERASTHKSLDNPREMLQQKQRRCNETSFADVLKEEVSKIKNQG